MSDSRSTKDVSDDRVAWLQSELLKSAKYRFLAPELLARLARQEVSGHKRNTDALKAVKRRLHQSFGAYLPATAIKRLDVILDRLEDGESVESTSRDALSCHRSSHERVDYFDEFCTTISTYTHNATHILDIAAGLNAFSLPFLQIGSTTAYTVLEVDSRIVERLNRYFQILSHQGTAVCCDALEITKLPRADVALILKTLPCFDRQMTGGAVKILELLDDVKTVVVSYPVSSFAGRNKGMSKNYLTQARNLAAAVNRRIDVLPLRQELVIVMAH